MSAILPQPPTVLIVDDEPLVREFLRCFFRMYFPAEAIISACDGREALQYLDSCTFPLVVTDHQMPRLTGLELIDIVKERYSDTRTILISGDVQNNIEQSGYEHGADYVLIKPFRVAALKNILEQVLPSALKERTVAYP